MLEIPWLIGFLNDHVDKFIMKIWLWDRQNSDSYGLKEYCKKVTQESRGEIQANFTDAGLNDVLKTTRNRIVGSISSVWAPLKLPLLMHCHTNFRPFKIVIFQNNLVRLNIIHLRILSTIDNGSIWMCFLLRVIILILIHNNAKYSSIFIRSAM